MLFGPNPISALCRSEWAETAEEPEENREGNLDRKIGDRSARLKAKILRDEESFCPKSSFRCLHSSAHIPAAGLAGDACNHSSSVSNHMGSRRSFSSGAMPALREALALNPPRSSGSPTPAIRCRSPPRWADNWPARPQSHAAASDNKPAARPARAHPSVPRSPCQRMSRCV